MKRVFAQFALGVLPLLTLAQDLPKPSPSGKVEQIIGLTKVTVDYSRPSAKGRVIFGDLVPFDQVWRTGANHCTTITLDGPVKVEGMDLAAGTYALFTTPGKENWVIHFNRKSDQWGATEYNEQENVLSVKVTPQPCEITETFTIGFADVLKDDATLDLRWEKTKVAVHINADATAKGLLNISEALAKPEAKADAYNRAAAFFLERGLKPQQALQYAQKSVLMERKYYNTFTLAEAFAATGDMTSAMKEGGTAVTLATKENDMGAVKNYQTKMEAWGKK